MKEVLKEYKVVWISILFSLIIEIFVCNYGFWRSLFVGNQQEVDYTISANKVKIENIDQRVTSVHFHYRTPLTKYRTYQVTMITEEKHAPTTLSAKTVSPKEQQAILLDTHSNCKSLEIEVIGETAILDTVRINKPIFRFNAFRVILLFLGALIFLKIKDGSIEQKEYDENARKQKIWDLAILGGICIALTIYSVIQINPQKLLLSPNEIATEYMGGSVDCISMQAEAWLNGQVELQAEPPKELAELENPYDIILREEEKISYLHDLAYYNGKYYNYFGVAPIFTSILPFRLLTGKYLPLWIFNMLYLSISIFALYTLYRKLIHRYIHKVSRFHFLLGFFAIFLASDILVLLRGMKYDIAISSGIAFLLIALNLAISVQEKTKTRNLKLVLLGLSTGLVVLSKPSFICHYLLIAFFFWNSIKDLAKKEKIKSIVIAMIPLAILAVFQMVFNYLRFDNILEFGAKYQLTVEDMTACMGITFGKILEGCILYLGKMPSINLLEFPFFSLSNNKNAVIMNERCYEQPLIGLLFLPILWVYFFAKEILKKPEEKELKHLIILIVISILLLIILNTCCAGITEVYCIDFKLTASIGAVLLMLKAMERKPQAKWMKKEFCMVCMVTILMMLPVGLFTNCDHWEKQPMLVFLENTFEFWK